MRLAGRVVIEEVECEALRDKPLGGPAPAAILVRADGGTPCGGSQYINSTATGRYEDAVKELVTYIDTYYRTMASRNHRGVNGKSSGGAGGGAGGGGNPPLFCGAAPHRGGALFEARCPPFFL